MRVRCCGYMDTSQYHCADAHFTGPRKVLRTGPAESSKGDPLVHIEKELDAYKFISVQGAPPFTGLSQDRARAQPSS